VNGTWTIEKDKESPVDRRRGRDREKGNQGGKEDFHSLLIKKSWFLDFWFLESNDKKVKPVEFFSDH
jgi:hypothetical protein